MDRRAFLAAITGSVLGAPLADEAQHAGKILIIGVLASESPDDKSRANALREGLRDLGYVEGRNIAIEWRWARGRAEAFPNFASELARLKVDVLTSLAKPGSNTSGLTSQSADLSAKRLQFLKGAVPNAARLAVLGDSTEPGRRAQATAMEDAGRKVGPQVVPRPIWMTPSPR